MRALPESNPLSPWETTHVEYLEEPPSTPLEIYLDDSKSILSKNSSPDVGFTFSVNPYRGCYHGCAYCYARPTHEYLGFGAGTDFERKILVKERAPELLRKALSRPSWRRQTIVFSGNTDCYQPLEATYRVTRGCLEVCAELSNPAHIITKAPLVERDIDILGRLAEKGLVGVTLSIPFWDAATARTIEPGVATPQRRLLAVERLAAAGIPVSVNVAPIIPGLSDRDIPKILEAAAQAGAHSADMIMVRLPGNVRPVFEERMRAGFPLTVEKILARTREMHGGKLNDPRFGHRMRGEGEYAAAVERLFDATVRRLGLNRRMDRERVATHETAATRQESGPGHGDADLETPLARVESTAVRRAVEARETPAKARSPRRTAARRETAGQLSLFRK